MKKTCYNCKKYISTLSNPTNPEFHIHDWCVQWGRQLDGYALAGQFEYEESFYDDLETGDACCYMFDPVDVPVMPDEWFENNHAHNLRSRIEE